MTRLERAKEILKDYCKNAPGSFAYWGDLPLGKTWGFTLAQTRDSDVLDKSNWHVISKDMQDKFPDDVEVIHCTHWAVGWIDHLAVRLINDDWSELTDAGNAILEWKEKLEEYPIADETDHSEREYEEMWENLEFDLKDYNLRDNLPKNWMNQVFDYVEPEFEGEDNSYRTNLKDALVSLGFLHLSELKPVAYYDFGDKEFYRYVVELEDESLIWLTADCLYGRGFVIQSDLVPNLSVSPIEITRENLPDNVCESLEVYMEEN